MFEFVEEFLVFLHSLGFWVLEMSGLDGEEGCVFEIAVVVPKLGENKGDESDDSDCVGVLVDQLRKRGLVIERVLGLQNEFIKVYSSLVNIFPSKIKSLVNILCVYHVI